MPCSSTDQHGGDPINMRMTTVDGVNSDMSDLLNELVTEYTYRTQADLETVDRKVDAQAIALLDLQCKLQEVVSRMALFTTSVSTGDVHSCTGGCETVSTTVSSDHQVVVGKKPGAAEKSGQTVVSDSDFLRNWLNTFRPVEEEQFKLELHRCKIDLDHDIQVAVQKLREDFESGLAGCVEVCAHTESFARLTKQETHAEVAQAKADLLGQNIECLLAVTDNSVRSSLLRKLHTKEEQQKRQLSKSLTAMGLEAATQSKNTGDPLSLFADGTDPSHTSGFSESIRSIRNSTAGFFSPTSQTAASATKAPSAFFVTRFLRHKRA